MQTLHAVERWATINSPDDLHLDSPLPQHKGRVRVTILMHENGVSEESDREETHWLKVATALQSPDFDDDVNEVFYGLEDGVPFDEQV